MIRNMTFNIAVGVSVVVLSFLYGISSGLKGRLDHGMAVAAFASPSSEPSDDSDLLKDLTLASGIEPIPIGHDVAINGHKADVVTFVSSRPIKNLLAEQVDIWKGEGLFTVGIADKNRGFAMAKNNGSEEMYTMIAWYNPALEKGFPGLTGKGVQGLISRGAKGMREGAVDEEMRGEVPGIPLHPQGKAGAVLSSNDLFGRGYTGGYTNPGTIEENIAYYQDVLVREGWTQLEDQFVNDKSRSGSVNFKRKGQMAMLLFSRLPGHESSEGVKTLVMVTVIPDKVA